MLTTSGAKGGVLARKYELRNCFRQEKTATSNVWQEKIGSSTELLM